MADPLLKALALARVPRQFLASQPRRARARFPEPGVLDIIIPLHLVDGATAQNGEGGHVSLDGGKLKVRGRIESKSGGVILQRWRITLQGKVAGSGKEYWREMKYDITRTPLSKGAIPAGVVTDSSQDQTTPERSGGLIDGMLGRRAGSRHSEDAEDSAFLRAYHDLRAGFLGKRVGPQKKAPAVDHDETPYHHWMEPNEPTDLPTQIRRRGPPVETQGRRAHHGG